MLDTAEEKTTSCAYIITGTKICPEKTTPPPTKNEDLIWTLLRLVSAVFILKSARVPGVKHIWLAHRSKVAKSPISRGI